jgi:GTP cyclohydrolase IA
MAEDSGSVSNRIRGRLQAKQQRFHANDNISAFIQPGEIEELTKEVAAKMSAVLESLVIDIEHDHNTRETARRVAKMYVNEVFRGRFVPMPNVTEFPNASHLNELMIMGPITVRSACSHHLCPIMGRLWIGVMPNQDSALIGLSKYSRIAERGVKDNASKMTNSVMRGVFLKDGALRREFLSLINLKP